MKIFKSLSKINLLWILLLFACGGGEEGLVQVQIISSQDQSVRGNFEAELADDSQEITMGLMFRQQLAENRGMFFLFPQDTENAFWMKNTLISLDIIFIDASGSIVSIVEKAEPQTTTLRHPAGPYRYVLEIIGGRSQQLGIVAGDQVNFQLP